MLYAIREVQKLKEKMEITLILLGNNEKLEINSKKYKTVWKFDNMHLNFDRKTNHGSSWKIPRLRWKWKQTYYKLLGAGKTFLIVKTSYFECLKFNKKKRVFMQITK